MFFTEVKIADNRGAISHSDNIWSIGSCFAQETGRRMADALFNIRVNPCGTLYNPMSIAAALERVASGNLYTESDIFKHNDMWHCMDFHSDFSASRPQTLLDKINGVVTTLHNELPRLDSIIITFGSARGFIDRENGKVAGNCHKLPSSRFDVHDFSITEICATFINAIAALRKVSPELKIIYTISPIRHKAYGYHADKLSKARLLIATDELCRTDNNADYFPAYEIMTDELRDYRFYAADMIHPSEVAVNHIFGKFLLSQCDEKTIALAKECESLTARLWHRPLNPDTPQAKTFAMETERLLKNLKQRNPQVTAAIARMLQNR